MQTERERISRALDVLTAGLYPFVEKELKAIYKHGWHDAALSSFRSDRGQGQIQGEVIRWDTHALLTVMWDQWNRVFRHRLTFIERSLIAELKEFRNRWAHQGAFDFDDTYRVLDSVERLLRAVSAREADRIAREKRDLMRMHFSREARIAYEKSQVTKRKWMDFFIYAVCCASLVFVIFEYFGREYWFFAAFVVTVFSYLAYQRTTAPPPMFYGPHECTSCGKIIYGECCPYCVAALPLEPVGHLSVQEEAHNPPEESEVPTEPVLV